MCERVKKLREESARVAELTKRNRELEEKLTSFYLEETEFQLSEKRFEGLRWLQPAHRAQIRAEGDGGTIARYTRCAVRTPVHRHVRLRRPR
jgi:hypothetical protein